MSIVKITVNDVSLGEDSAEAGFLARYSLALTDMKTNEQYTGIVVDLNQAGEEESDINCSVVEAPSEVAVSFNSEKLRQLLLKSYYFHTEEGGIIDNFLFFGGMGSPVHFEIGEDGSPVEVHYMSLAG